MTLAISVPARCLEPRHRRNPFPLAARDLTRAEGLWCLYPLLIVFVIVVANPFIGDV